MIARVMMTMRGRKTEWTKTLRETERIEVENAQKTERNGVTRPKERIREGIVRKTEQIEDTRLRGEVGVNIEIVMERVRVDHDQVITERTAQNLRRHLRPDPGPGTGTTETRDVMQT